MKRFFLMNEMPADGQPAGGAPTQDPAPSAAPAPDASKSWYSGFDELTRGYVEQKGFKDPAAVVNSYQNLEKLMGHERAGRTMVLPKDDQDTETLGKIYDRLGRPAAPEDYKLPVPEGDQGEFAKVAASKFHELGLSSKQGQALAEWFNGHGTQLQQQQEAAFERQRDEDFGKLEAEWGNQFEVRSEVARRAMREAGLSPEEGAMLERTLGVHKAAKAFEFFGKLFTEHGGKGFENSGGGKFSQTPEEAKARINTLTKDKAWQQRYFAKDADAVAEFDRLQKTAYPS
jgi:hypothetical protein